jgi:hypothetical protein
LEDHPREPDTGRGHVLFQRGSGIAKAGNPGALCLDKIQGQDLHLPRDGRRKRQAGESDRRRLREDKTPGILFYDNDSGKMVLEDEQYIEANFKDFRTPSLLLWKIYYNAVCSYIDKNILD